MSMTPVVIFDIETVPDTLSGKRMNPSFAELSDRDIQQAMVAQRQAEGGSQFVRLPLHKIACLSMLWVDVESNQMKLKSFSLNEMTEDAILSTFFGIFNPHKLPNLVSWNGSGFDIPVMMYRAMHHKLTAPTFFHELGAMKYNNYLNRYHTRHLDLMDKMTLHGYNRQPLDTVAGVYGFAGKQEIDGSMVVDLVNNNDWQTLTTYCETDVLNTWLVYLRWQLLTGGLNAANVEALEQSTRKYLAQMSNTTDTLNNTATAMVTDISDVAIPSASRHARFLNNWI